VVRAELARLIRGVCSIRGVSGVENLLTVQENSESLFGHYRPAESRAAFVSLRRPLSETTRFLMGAFGSILTFGGAVRRNINGATMTIMGMALLAGALGTSRYWSGARPSRASGAAESGIPHHNGAGNSEG
jgi:hypothetical protein